MSGELTLTITLNRPVVSVMAAPQQAYLLIEATPTETAPARPQSVNFGLALDRSGSMAGDKLRNLKDAAKLIVDRLGPQDILSITIFDERADTIISGQPVTDREALKRKIDAIQERGGTRMSVGMQAGLTEVARGLAPGRVSGMLLLTDGQTWEDQPICEQLADQARLLGVPLHVMGMGVGAEGDWDPRFLESLAQRSGGEWYVVDKPDKVCAVFEKALSAMQGAVVTNASLTLRLSAEVTPRHVWRVSPLIGHLDHREVAERDVQTFLGDIQRGVGQSLLVEVLLPARQAGSYRLMHADVTYDVPAANLSFQKITTDVVVAYSEDAAQVSQPNPRMMNIIERLVAHKLQTQALDEAAAGQVQNATRRLRAAATRLLDLGENEMAQNALAQAQKMEQGAALDPAAAQQMRYETKKLAEHMPEP